MRFILGLGLWPALALAPAFLRAGLPAIGRIMQILNIAAYKFVALDQLPALKAELRRRHPEIL